MADEHEDVCRRLAGIGPTERRLVDACERLLAVHGPVTLPTGDLVHGDFRPGNILIDADHVSGVIDIEALGSGTRIFDYATLLSAHTITPDALRLLVTAGEQVDGPGALAFCFAHVVLGLAVFVHDRNLLPGIENISGLAERTEFLLGRTTAANRPDGLRDTPCDQA